MTRQPRSRVAGAALVAVVALGATAALGAGVDGAMHAKVAAERVVLRATKTVARTAVPGTRHRVVPASLLRDFAVLKHAHVAASSEAVQLPAEYAAAIAGSTDPQSPLYVYGPNAALAQYVAPTGTLGMWLVPGSGGLCFHVVSSTANASQGSGQGGYGVCSTTANAELGRAFVFTELGNGSDLLVGVAPNAAKSVAITLGDGSTETIPVVDDVYAVTASAVAAVTVDDAAGATQTYNMPASAGPPTT